MFASDVVVVSMLGVVGVIMTGIVGPLLVAQRTQRGAAEVKRKDWERQDEVAARAAEAAELLLAANERVAETAAITNGKLDVIHTLVNSNMTAAMQSEYDATVRERAMMLEVVALKRQAGLEPTPEVIAAIEATDRKIAELGAALADRLRAAEMVEKQLAARAAGVQ